MARRKQNVLGLAKVLRVFRQLPKENLKRITNSLNLGADEIVGRAKLLAEDSRSDPIAGQEHMADTIRRTPIRRVAASGRFSEKVSVFVLAGVGDKDSEIDNAAFRTEFGRAPGEGHPGHSPQPFFFPAYHSIRKRVRSRVAREVNRAAKAVVARNR